MVCALAAWLKFFAEFGEKSEQTCAIVRTPKGGEGVADRSVQAKLRSQMAQTALAVIRAVDGALAAGDASWEMLRDAAEALSALSGVLERGDGKGVGAGKSSGAAGKCAATAAKEKSAE